MTERPPRPPRADSREIAELKEIRDRHPELASAVDMQIELVEMQRRVQSRVPLPWIQHDGSWLDSQRQAARPAVRFGDIPLEWSDLRLALRHAADILHRYEAIDQADYDRIVAISREGDSLAPLVTGWYNATSRVHGGNPGERLPGDVPACIDQVLVLALRPFLARCAEALLPRPEFALWRHAHCPVCGWEPDFAVITPAGERKLICGRCLAQWAFDPLACPFCGNDERARITSFASRDGRYRVAACEQCKRYLKAYDARNAPRPVLVAVDSIATLPLDAAAIQRGYLG